MRPHDRVLIVDDDAESRLTLAAVLKGEGYVVETAADGFKALPKLEEFQPDLLLSDLHMPAMSGMELLKRVMQRQTGTVVILMTAYSSADTAVAALKQGAADYLTKPIRIDELVLTIRRSLERVRLRAETTRLRARLSQQERLSHLVGESPAMREMGDAILQVAPTLASVLVLGESGTGKELVAAAIHEHSQRADGPFVKLHCAALSESLLESELFGHEKGAFTAPPRAAPARRYRRAARRRSPPSRRAR